MVIWVPPHGQIKFDCRQVNGREFHRRQFGAAQIMRSEKKASKRRFRRQSILFDLRQNLLHLGPVEGTHGMALDVAE